MNTRTYPMPFPLHRTGSIHFNTPSPEPTPAPAPAPVAPPAPSPAPGKTYTQAELDAERARWEAAHKPADTSALTAQIQQLQAAVETEKNARLTIENQQKAAKREDAKRTAFKTYVKSVPTLSHILTGETADDHLDTLIAKFDKAVPADVAEDKFPEHAKAVADAYAKLVAVPQPGGPPAPNPSNRPPAPAGLDDVTKAFLNQVSYNPTAAKAN